MLDLLIATLEMMGLTFVIGFFVAFIKEVKTEEDMLLCSFYSAIDYHS